jgi:enterobacterial common antigen flippase
MRRSVALTIASRVVQIVSAFAGTIVTARFLGPDARGEYFFVVTVALLVVQFANLGLHSSNTYHVASDAGILPSLVSNSVWVSVVVGAGGAALVAGLIQATGLYSARQTSLAWCAVALVPGILFFMLGTNLLVGIQRITAFNVVEAASNLGVAAALVAAGVLGLRAGGFLAVSACAWTVASCCVLLLLSHGVKVAGRFDTAEFRRGFGYALKAYLVATLGFLVLRGNVFLLQHDYGSRELGFYSVAAQVADALAILPASVALVLFPHLIRGTSAPWRSTVRSFVVVTATLLVVCGIAAAVARPFVEAAFGNRFAPAATVLRLMLPGVVALGGSTVFSQFLAAVGVPRTLVVAWLAALVCVFALGRLLIPRHAGAGAAVALSGTYCLLLVLVSALAYRHRQDPVGAARPAAISQLEVATEPQGAAL